MASLPSLEDPDRPLHAIPGQVPDLARVDQGCRFRNRCPLAIAACAQPVALREVAPLRQSRCLRAGEVAA
jgi:oligopeptide/dipeptide ABC transporter ATP-binding protein